MYAPRRSNKSGTASKALAVMRTSRWPSSIDLAFGGEPALQADERGAHYHESAEEQRKKAGPRRCDGANVKQQRLPYEERARDSQHSGDHNTTAAAAECRGQRSGCWLIQQIEERYPPALLLRPCCGTARIVVGNELAQDTHCFFNPRSLISVASFSSSLATNAANCSEER